MCLFSPKEKEPKSMKNKLKKQKLKMLLKNV